MKVLILGEAGPTGKCALKEALEECSLIVKLPVISDH